jgi:murein DD-endopeptidase MepM/ murein hydrolase activator NlpD
MAKHLIINILVVIIIAGGVFLYFKNPPSKIASLDGIGKINSGTAISMPDKNSPVKKNSEGPKQFLVPLDRSTERISKKPFGIFITPQNSPVRPEKFQGYHTGADFEIFPEELDMDIPVKAICDGTLALKKYASGYGGVVVESCSFDNQPITIIYGHLKLSSVSQIIGDTINTGDTLGILGKNNSTETNGERKHLHLGFHKGPAINILGYVQNRSALAGWIDPCLYVCN